VYVNIVWKAKKGLYCGRLTVVYDIREVHMQAQQTSLSGENELGCFANILEHISEICRD
jgi:hypothetical protein